MQNKLKLLVITQLFYPEMISTGQTLTELCEELARRHIQIKVICGPPTISADKQAFSKEIKHSGILIRRVWGTRFPKLKIWGRILNQVTFTISALIHLGRHTKSWPVMVNTNPPFLPLICSLLSKLQGRPYIYLVFDLYPDTLINLGVIKSQGFLDRLWKRANRSMLKQARSIISIGRDMQARLTKTYQDQTSGKMHYIPIWCDDHLIRSSHAPANPYIQKWGLENKFVALYSGNMGRFHDMDTILAAAKILYDRSDIIFLFVGEGYKKEEMQREVQGAGLKNCRFHTYVPRSDLGHAINCADIGLVSLLPGQEGLSVPSKTLSYMAAGLPVISIMGENSEVARIVKESSCGWIIQPGKSKELAETIAHLSLRPPILKERGDNAAASIKNRYSLSIIADAYLPLIEKLNHSLRSSPKKIHNN